MTVGRGVQKAGVLVRPRWSLGGDYRRTRHYAVQDRVTAFTPKILALDFIQFGNVPAYIDPAKWAAGVSVEFQLEAVLKTGSAIYPSQARLYNITDGNYVGGAAVATIATTPTLVESLPFTLPAGRKLYRVDFGGTPSGSTYTCYEARVKVTLTS